MIITKLLKAVSGLVLAVQGGSAYGEIVIDRTRVIYPAAARGVTVNLHNKADGPRLIQAWIDEGDPQALPELSDVPFTVTPPVLRLETGKTQALRVVHHPVPGHAATPPEESVYWLNVLGIRPTVEAGNQVQFSLRTRIKLFLRPDGLNGPVEGAVQALQWWRESDRPGLHVRNPSAFHVSLSSVVLTLDGIEYRNEEPPMLPPRSTTNIAITGTVAPWQGPATLRFSTLDDQGATHVHTVPFSGLGRMKEDVAR